MRTLGALAVVTVAALGCKRSGSVSKNEPPPRRDAAEKVTVPALSAGDEEGLTFAIETARTTDPAGRRLRLQIGGGEATLTLYEPSNKNAEMAFGQGVLQATDGAHGATLVAAVARWLGQSPPAPPGTAGELQPFPITYVRLGADDAWEANKLFLQNGSLEAEVFLNLRRDGKQARLVEKDEDYRRSLLALLAIAVRDGKPPRRTSGPDLAGAAPLVASLAPIAGSGGVAQPQTWMGDTWIAALEGGATQKVLYWSDLAKEPRQLAEVAGSVLKIVPSPKRDRVALLVIHPKRAGELSSDDPGELLVAALGGGPVRPVVPAGGDFNPGMLSRVVWSPDGATLATDAMVSGKPPSGRQVRVYDATSGKLIASPAAPGAVPLRWEGDTMILEQWTSTGRQRWRWRPGSGEPTLERKAPASVRSPDGRYTLAFHETSVDISGPGGRRRFQPRSEGDRAAIEALSDGPEDAQWLGGSTLVLVSETPMALDLATAKLRYVFADDAPQFMSASDDGTIVVARDDAKRLFWGRVAAKR